MRVLVVAIVVAASVTGVACGEDDDVTLGEQSRDRPNETVVRADTAPDPTTSTSTTAPRTPLQVSGQGFSQLRPDSIGNSYVSYGVVVRNPNATVYAENVRVSITFLDAGSKVVASKSETISVILPAQEAAIGDTTSAADVTKIDVQVLGDDWSDPLEPVGAFRTEGVSTRQQQYGGLKTTGTIVSTFAKNIENPKAVVIYKDASGAVLGGAYTYVDFVPAGGRIGFEVTGSVAVPGVTSTSVYVSLTSLSLLN